MDDHVDLEVPCLFCGPGTPGELLHPRLPAPEGPGLLLRGLRPGLLLRGEEGPVFAATARLERAADKLKEEQAAEEKAAFLDEIVMHEVLSEVKDIAARGGVSCACGSREWKLKVNYSSIDLICAQCGAQMRIPAATADDIDDICCKNTILIRGKK